jgi:uncharacterized cupin superfamily protein
LVNNTQRIPRLCASYFQLSEEDAGSTEDHPEMEGGKVSGERREDKKRDGMTKRGVWGKSRTERYGGLDSREEPRAKC